MFNVCDVIGPEILFSMENSTAGEKHLYFVYQITIRCIFQISLICILYFQISRSKCCKLGEYFLYTIILIRRNILIINYCPPNIHKQNTKTLHHINLHERSTQLLSSSSPSLVGEVKLQLKRVPQEVTILKDE